jgi:hypothetical protein
MSSEAVRDLRLELGSVAIAVVKATTVIIQTPPDSNEKNGSSPLAVGILLTVAGCSAAATPTP